MDNRLKRACEGKTKSQGGLNVSDLRKLPGASGYTRSELLQSVCDWRSRTPSPPREPSPVPIVIPQFTPVLEYGNEMEFDVKSISLKVVPKYSQSPSLQSPNSSVFFTPPTSPEFATPTSTFNSPRYANPVSSPGTVYDSPMDSPRYETPARSPGTVYDSAGGPPRTFIRDQQSPIYFSPSEDLETPEQYYTPRQNSTLDEF